MLENNLIYKDNYMFFSFNNIRSKDYNLMIQNEPNSFKIITNDNANISYTTPQNQNGKYVMGVTHPHRTIPHKLVAYGLDSNEIQAMANWLASGTCGSLIYDYAPDWHYNVIISQLSDMNLYAIDSIHFIVSFDIQFETIEGTYAKNTYDSTLRFDIDNLEGQTLFYGCNNSKSIPTLACYNNTDNNIPMISNDAAAHRISFPIFIHHLGNGFATYDITAAFQESDVIIDGKWTDMLSISVDTSKDKSSISYKTNSVTLVNYMHKTNLFFINNLLPEQKLNNESISSLDLAYNREIVNIPSPGPIQKINTNKLNDELNKYLTTPYSWFIVCTNDPIDPATFYIQPTEQSEQYFVPSYPDLASAEFLYDKNYEDQTTWSALINTVASDINSSGKNHVFFGFYNILTIITTTNLSMLSITSSQYNKLLLGE